MMATALHTKAVSTAKRTNLVKREFVDLKPVREDHNMCTIQEVIIVSTKAVDPSQT